MGIAPAPWVRFLAVLAGDDPEKQSVDESGTQMFQAPQPKPTAESGSPTLAAQNQLEERGGPAEFGGPAETRFSAATCAAVRHWPPWGVLPWALPGLHV